MKTDVHPTYHTDTKVICSCGNTFITGSTVTEIKVELCSKCHPFYTGQLKYVDTLGRVEKFQKKQKEAEKTQAVLVIRKKQKQDQKKQDDNAPKTLREMLLGR
jgi:large subunit ribosomal protein L31